MWSRLMTALSAVWCPETGSDALFSFFAELAWIQGFPEWVTDAVRCFLTVKYVFMRYTLYRCDGKKKHPRLAAKTLFGQWGLASVIILLTAAVSFPLLSPRSHMPTRLVPCWQCHPHSSPGHLLLFSTCPLGFHLNLISLVRASFNLSVKLALFSFLSLFF